MDVLLAHESLADHSVLPEHCFDAVGRDRPLLEVARFCAANERFLWNPTLHFVLGRLCWQARLLEEAGHAFDRAASVNQVSSHPNFVLLSHLAAGIAWRAAGNYTTGINSLMRATAAAPLSARALLELGEVLELSGSTLLIEQVDQLIDLYDAVAGDDSVGEAEADAGTSRGTAPEMAARFFVPTEAEVMSLGGRVALKHGLARRARKMLAIAAEARDAAALLALAKLAASEGSASDAERLLREAVAAAPLDPRILSEAIAMDEAFGGDARVREGWAAALAGISLPRDLSLGCAAVEAASLSYGAAFVYHRRRLAGKDRTLLRVGILVAHPDPGQGPGASLLALAVLRQLDPRSFAPFVYVIGPVVSSELRHALDTFVPTYSVRDVQGQSPKSLADFIATDGIHVLLDASSRPSRLALQVMARRPSPVQALWGLQDPAGAPNCDFVTAVRAGPRALPRRAGSTAVRLAITTPSNIGITSTTPPPPLPTPKMTRPVTFFASAASPRSFTPGLIAAWCAIVERAGDAHLELRRPAERVAEVNLAARLAHCGARNVTFVDSLPSDGESGIFLETPASDGWDLLQAIAAGRPVVIPGTGRDWSQGYIASALSGGKFVDPNFPGDQLGKPIVADLERSIRAMFDAWIVSGATPKKQRVVTANFF